MALFRSQWTIQGVSPEAREAALIAASESGEKLGIWLGRLIREIDATEISAAAAGRDLKDTRPISDDKLTSIERAMLRSGPGELTGNLGSA